MKKLTAVLCLLLVALCMAEAALAAGAECGPGTSEAWRKALDARTASMWVDAQFLGRMVLNARARLIVTWLPRSLLKRLKGDQRVDEWVSDGLSYYYSTIEETQQRVKGRDILCLRYRAEKSWTFDPTELTFGDYRVRAEDLLGHKDFRVIGDLPPGAEGVLYVCVPSPEPGRSLNVSLGPDEAVMDLPRR
ncbi:MAG: hypothetical protein IJ702_04555 [Fretibacterium sp.]|nr:hypothetical protein [Fretibacterium sp.]